MKPQPSANLLGDGQVFEVIESPGWALATTPRRCRYDIGEDRARFCGERAVAIQYVSDGKPIKDGFGFCAKHIGSHRWVSKRKVWQWRASSSPDVGEAPPGAGSDRRRSEVTA